MIPLDICLVESRLSNISTSEIEFRINIKKSNQQMKSNHRTSLSNIIFRSDYKYFASNFNLNRRGISKYARSCGLIL